MPELTKCACGTTYRLDDDLDGEKIRCIGCGEMLRVGEVHERRSERPSRRDRDDDRDDRPLRKRKRRRRRSSGLPFEPWVLDLVGGVVLAFTVLICGGLGMTGRTLAPLLSVSGPSCR